MSKKIGEIIKSIRKQRGMTQADVADRLYMSAQNISRVENGDGEPTVEMLIKMSEIFDVSVDTLVGRDELPKDELLEKTSVLFKGAREREVRDRVFEICKSMLQGRFEAHFGDAGKLNEKSTYSSLITHNMIAAFSDRADCPKLFLAVCNEEINLSDKEKERLARLFDSLSDPLVLSVLAKIVSVSESKMYDKASLCAAFDIPASDAERVISALQICKCLNIETIYIDGDETTLYLPLPSKKAFALLQLARLLYLHKTDGNVC